MGLIYFLGYSNSSNPHYFWNLLLSRKTVAIPLFLSPFVMVGGGAYLQKQTNDYLYHKYCDGKTDRELVEIEKKLNPNIIYGYGKFNNRSDIKK